MHYSVIFIGSFLMLVMTPLIIFLLLLLLFSQ